MTNELKMRVAGGEALARKLALMGAEASAALELAAVAGMAVIEGTADTLAPGPHLTSETTERKKDVATVEMGPDKKHWYYRFFEYGAGEHVIVSEKAAALVFEGRKGLVVTGEVKHPGMAARPFLRPSFDENHRRAKKQTGAVLRKVILRGTR